MEHRRLCAEREATRTTKAAEAREAQAREVRIQAQEKLEKPPLTTHCDHDIEDEEEAIDATGLVITHKWNVAALTLERKLWVQWIPGRGALCRHCRRMPGLNIRQGKWIAQYCTGKKMMEAVRKHEASDAHKSAVDAYHALKNKKDMPSYVVTANAQNLESFV